jgi:hypothetical protein
MHLRRRHCLTRGTQNKSLEAVKWDPVPGRYVSGQPDGLLTAQFC